MTQHLDLSVQAISGYSCSRPCMAQSHRSTAGQRPSPAPGPLCAHLHASLTLHPFRSEPQGQDAQHSAPRAPIPLQLLTLQGKEPGVCFVLRVGGFPVLCGGEGTTSQQEFHEPRPGQAALLPDLLGGLSRTLQPSGPAMHWPPPLLLFSPHTTATTAGKDIQAQS